MSLNNNFSLIRLVLATMVVLGHFKILPGNPSGGIYSYADFGVDAFFVVSGYLVTGSFDRQPHIGSFYIRRFFRIYPLYIVVILIQALIMLCLLPASIGDHMRDFAGYLLPSLVFANFMAHDMGDLLSGLNNNGINPSLWTLKVEFAFYLILPFICFLVRRYGMGVLIFTYIASTIIAEIALHYGADTFHKQLPCQMRFFAVGIALYYYRDRITPNVWLATLLSIVFFVLCSFREELPISTLYPLFVGGLVFLCALRLPAMPLKTDISYGVYLLHGPIIQFSILLGLFYDNIYFLLLLLVSVYLLAFVMGHIIEQPGINLGHKLARKFANRKSSTPEQLI